MSKITPQTFRAAFEERAKTHADSVPVLEKAVTDESGVRERNAPKTATLHSNLSSKIAGMSDEAVKYAVKVLSPEAIEVLKSGSRNLKRNAIDTMEAAAANAVCKNKPIAAFLSLIADKTPTKVSNREIAKKVLGDATTTQADYLIRFFTKLGLGSRERIQAGLYELTPDYGHPVVSDLVKTHKTS